MKTIALDVFHSMLANAYAVVVGDTLYYVGYDNEDQPYVADNDGNDRLELSEVDGDIQVVNKHTVCFCVGGDEVELSFLELTEISVDNSNQ